jgi:hypothetical protein
MPLIATADETLGLQARFAIPIELERLDMEAAETCF